MQPDPEFIMLDLPDGMPPVCCAVRRSLKAKRFFLRVIPHPFSVQLVIPKRRSVASGRKFAESKIAWLAATIRRLAPEPGAMPRGPGVPASLSTSKVEVSEISVITPTTALVLEP